MTPNPRSRVVAFFLLAALFAGGSCLDAVAQTAVTSCGQTFSGSGYLAADLDCSATFANAVTITGSGSLDLAGFTLTADSGNWGVVCETCTVFSSAPGGTIEGAARAISGPDLTAVGIAIQGGFIGIFGSEVVLEDVTVDGTAEAGAYGGDKMTITDSTFTNTGGVYADRLKLYKTAIRQSHEIGVGGRIIVLKDCTVSDGTLTGIHSSTNGNVRIRRHHSVNLLRTVVTGNAGDGVASVKVRSTDSFIDLNGENGIRDSRSLTVSRTSISSNGKNGVLIGDELWKANFAETNISDNGENGVAAPPGFSAVPVALRKTSDASTNGTSADCGVSLECADLNTTLAPQLDATSSCGTSHVYGSGIPGSDWNVCSAD